MRNYTNIGGNNLVTFLQTNTHFVEVELYTVTLLNGTVLRRISRWDTPFTDQSNSHVFLPTNPQFIRSAIEDVIGYQVSTLDFEILALPTDILSGSITIFHSIMVGMWDGAQVLIERLWMDGSGNQIGKITRWFGELGDIKEIGRTKAVFNGKSMVQRLNQKAPRNLLQPGCLHMLYDAGCTLNKSSFLVSGIVQSGSTVNKLLTNLTNADGYFDLGTLTFTSGANNGLSATVKQYLSTSVYFNRPLLFVPSNGDTFSIYPGCDKQQATCSGKFSNLANFKGFPYVPAPETAL